MKKTVAAMMAALLLASAGTIALAQGSGQGAPGAPAAGEQRGGRQGLSQDDFNLAAARRAAARSAARHRPPSTPGTPPTRPWCG